MSDSSEELLSSYVALVTALSKTNLIYLNTETQSALARSREVLRKVREERRKVAPSQPAPSTEK